MSDDQGSTVDPRPVFDGSWSDATGDARAEHMRVVKAWKERQGALGDAAKAGGAGSRMGARSDQPVPRIPPPDAAALHSDPRNRAVLEAIRDDRNALPSDRIRATQTLLQAERGAAAQGQGESDLGALRDTLALLDPAERLAWLQGERAEHAAQGG
jgi:hypothetical protein